jgi:hypothetical protein
MEDDMFSTRSKDNAGAPRHRAGTVLGLVVGLLLIAVMFSLMGLFLWGFFYAARRWPLPTVGGFLGVCSALTALTIVHTFLLRRRGVTVQGTIVSVRTKNVLPGRTITIATVGYRTPDGVERTMEDSVVAASSPGQSYIVIYDPRRPSRAQAPSSWGDLAIRVVIFFAFVISAVWCLISFATSR